MFSLMYLLFAGFDTDTENEGTKSRIGNVPAGFVSP